MNDKIILESIFDEELTKLLSQLSEGQSGELEEFFDKLRIKAEEVAQNHEKTKKTLYYKRQELWGEAISGLKYLNNVLLELDYLFEKANYDRKNINVYKYYVGKRIHARIVQIIEEIVALIENGYPNGAMARWRSLYELQIVLKFFAIKKDDTLFQMYYDHGILKTYELEKMRRENGEQTLTTKVYHEYESTVEKMQYDKDKFSGEHGWAYKYIKGNKCRFSDIEQQAISYSKMRIYYKHASAIIHLSALGTFDNLSAIEKTDIFPCGCSNYGLSMPGQLTVISICNVIESYNEIFNSIYGDNIEKFIFTQAEYIKEKFASAQKKIEKDSDLLVDMDEE